MAKTKLCYYDGIPIYYEKKHVNKAFSIVIGFFAGQDKIKSKHRGIAHFAEHMMFNSAKHKWGMDPLKKLYDEFYSFDAATGGEHIFVKVYDEKKQLENAFKRISELLFNRIINDEDVQKEKSIIVNEALRSVTHKALHEDKFFEIVWGIKNYTTYSILGNPEEINAITKEELEKYYENYFVKDNFFIKISGNFSLTKVKKLYNKYFKNNLPSGGIKTEPFEQFVKKEVKPFKTHAVINNVEGCKTNYVTLAAHFGFDLTPKNLVLCKNVVYLMNRFQENFFKYLRAETSLLYAYTARMQRVKDGMVLEFNFNSDLNKIPLVLENFSKALREVQTGEYLTEKFIEYSEKMRKRDKNCMVKKPAKPNAYSNISRYENYKEEIAIKKYRKVLRKPKNFKLINEFMKDFLKFDRAVLIVTTEEKVDKIIAPKKLEKLILN